MSITENIKQIHKKIIDAKQRFARHQDVSLLAVSKTRLADELMEAYKAGQRAFAESYLQEALVKIEALHSYPIEWHFIGPIQANKCKLIAANFDWVHSLARIKVAARLDHYRAMMPSPLNVCLQVNISQESTKDGFLVDELEIAAKQVLSLKHLKLRGLMAIPAPSHDFEQQRRVFRKLARLRDDLQVTLAHPLDCLSMGMSEDYLAAIAEGATIVRIGTAVFGQRKPKE